MNVLEARNLSCGYGTRRVLEGLSFSAHAGEVLVVLGPNGSGKTTLLRALARLLQPTQGTVLLNQQDIWKLPAHKFTRQVALAPQTERRDWPLTVEESVQLGRTPHRGWLLPFTAEDRRIVHQALEWTGMNELRDRLITELAGGEWRRMILARALAQQANVLLLDEPIGGLDLKYQVEILQLVRQLAIQQQLIAVLTLHDLNQASLYGDRIAVLSERSLVAIGPPDEVLTAELISRTFDIPVTVMSHPAYNTPLIVPLHNTDDSRVEGIKMGQRHRGTK